MFRQTTRILARALYKDMRTSGIPQEKVLEVASELIALVTRELESHLDPTGSGPDAGSERAGRTGAEENRVSE